MTEHRPKAPRDQQAPDAARARLAEIGARTPRHLQPVKDGELAHLTPAERRAELRRRSLNRPQPPTGNDAA